MAIVRITKFFEFEMAHLLDNYDGLCRNIHGHSYKLAVTARGQIITDADSPKLGMVLDFSILKRIVKEHIVDRLDHALLVRRNTPQAQKLTGIADRIYTVDYQPTCENMVVDFAQIIKKYLPQGIELVSLRLNETSTSYAEWFEEDNV